MCGIFGLALNKDSNCSTAAIVEAAEELFVLSSSRGKDAAGLAIRNGQGIKVLKQPVPAGRFLRSDEYAEFAAKFLTAPQDGSLSAIGHCRMVTNGQEDANQNNHPVITESAAAVHNGIVTNVDRLWLDFPQLKKKHDVDTEVLLRLFDLFYEQSGSAAEAVKKVFAAIEGETSFALFHQRLPFLILATNNGSLYYVLEAKRHILFFASERYILETFIKDNQRNFQLDGLTVEKLPANEALIVNLDNFNIDKFNFRSDAASIAGQPTDNAGSFRPIADLSRPSDNVPPAPSLLNAAADYGLLQYQAELPLKRCTRCILPETFPGIAFDDAGICNICNSHKKKISAGPAALNEELGKYRGRKSKSGYDCLVAFSGGRDSSYGLHYIKKHLGLNPLTFTYDWGMVTDLARRNQARLCGKLGVEHIIVSADIKKKRANIKRNVETWLKNPDLGLVPLFMAGDKQFFYYANKLMQQNDISLMVFCENEKLENTKFKTGFCGVKEGNNRWANMPAMQKLKLASYYGRKFLTNPGYLNSSLLDTAFAYLSTYFIKHDYLFLYRFLDWNEQEINRVLINDYNWETATDTDSTWRIGDGTAPFYNYIYYTVAGFTENDTFRSNQIREGLISREEALNCVKIENRPRPESLKWYCDTIGLDFNSTIKAINSINKLYKL